MNTRDREALRHRIRNRRERLDTDQREIAANRVAEQLTAQPFLRQARTVAAYHAMGGELDPAPTLERLHESGTCIYLPVLDPERARTLFFRQWTPATPMSRNRLGIPEPSGTSELEPHRLDVVLVPLVACDGRGNRLGMGGGYYDTTFAWRLSEAPARPRLVGMAYDFQVVERLSAMPWDVPLDHIATPDGVATCSIG